MRDAHMDWTEDELKNVFEHFDANGSGSIRYLRCAPAAAPLELPLYKCSMNSTVHVQRKIARC